MNNPRKVQELQYSLQNPKKRKDDAPCDIQPEKY